MSERTKLLLLQAKKEYFEANRCFSGVGDDSNDGSDFSDAESELNDDQIAVLEELEGVFDDWSCSPLRLEKIEENSQTPQKLEACRNLFSSDAKNHVTKEIDEKGSKNEEIPEKESEQKESEQKEIEEKESEQSEIEEKNTEEKGSEKEDGDEAFEHPVFYSEETSSSISCSEVPIPFNDDFEQLMKDPKWFTSITSAHTNNSVTDPSSDRNNLSEATSSIDQSNLSEVTSSIDQNHLSGVTSSIDQDNLSEVISTTDQNEQSKVISSTDQNEQSKVISSTDQKKVSKKKYYKHREHYCIFCRKLVTCFTRHIKSNVFQHDEKLLKNELEADTTTDERKQEISKLLILIPLLKEYSLKDTSNIRRQQISAILKGKGDLEYNLGQVEEGKEMLPARNLALNSKVKSVSLDTFVACPECHMMYKEKTLCRHMKICKVQVKEVDPSFKKMKRKLRVLQKERAECSNLFTQNKNTTATKLLREKVFPIFTKDETALIAKNDEVICLFGSEIIQNHLQFNQLRQVATRMRELARLLVKLRKLDKSIKSLSDALFPSKFKYIVEATRELCRYDEMSGKVDVISIPTRIGTSIKLCIQLNMCRIIENESTPQDVALSAQRDAELMQTLFSNRWAFNVSRNAEKSKRRKDASKSQIIADNNDVKLFTEYLEDQLLHHYSELQLGQDLFPNFEKLCKILIALIIIYNRRRAGEAARIELHYYVNRDLQETNKEIFNSMSSSQQAAAKMFSSFNILGKRTRRVPVLITKNMERAIDRLIELRSQVAISENNPYLFPKLYSENPHDGTKILQELRSKIKLKNPTALTSRGLRTNIATMSAVCNIDSQKKEKLARALGHDRSTHESHYALPQKEIERGVIGEILLPAAKGNMVEKFSQAGSSTDMHSECQPDKPNKTGIASKTHESTQENQTEDDTVISNDVLLNDEEGATCYPCSKTNLDDSEEDSTLHASETELQNKENTTEQKSDSSASDDKSSSPVSIYKRSHPVIQDSSDSDEEILSAKVLKLKRSFASMQKSKKQEKLPQGRVAVRKTPAYTLNSENVKKPKRRWSREERKAVKRQLRECFENRVNPGKPRSIACIVAEPILHGRQWTQINGIVNNWIKGKQPKGDFSDLSD